MLAVFDEIPLKFVGELTCICEVENTKDPFAVSVVFGFALLLLAMSLERYQPHVPCS